MPRIDPAAFEFSLSWQSEAADHVDRLYLDSIDLQRDIFPGDMQRTAPRLQPGESISADFDPGQLTPPDRPQQRLRFARKLFDGGRSPVPIVPRTGRFYPQCLAPKVFNCFKGDLTPFRLIEVDDQQMLGDGNHPLARYPLTLTATRMPNPDRIRQYAAARLDIGEQVTLRGPGMQAPHAATDTDFFGAYPFARDNDEDDARHYLEPRLVPHLDSPVRRQLSKLHTRLLGQGDRVLDLMSSHLSHVSAELNLEMTGLGMNAEELAANKRLSDFIVQDLNRLPRLPFDDNSFDGAICTSSVEYLTDPLAVMREMARVIRPAGVFVCSFSNRWFPGKQIQPWGEMHPFERLGLVLDLYRREGLFCDLHSESIRGYPGPRHDRQPAVIPAADPLYAVWGRVSG